MAIESSRIYPTIKWVDLSIAFLYVYQRVRFTTYHKKKIILPSRMRVYIWPNIGKELARNWNPTSKNGIPSNKRCSSIKHSDTKHSITSQKWALHIPFTSGLAYPPVIKHDTGNSIIYRLIDDPSKAANKYFGNFPASHIWWPEATKWSPQTL